MEQAQKDIIIESFSKMDIGKLGSILNDSTIYQYAKKEVFIKKLAELFYSFKHWGDTSLEVYTGKYYNENYFRTEWNANAFRGNVSKVFTFFVIDEIRSEVTDIFGIDNIILNDISITKGELNNNRILEIGEDEKHSFKTTTKYLKLINDCETAYKELSGNGITYLNKKDYIKWLVKYCLLYDSISSAKFSDYRRIAKFKKIYTILKEITNVLSKEEEVVNAINQYDNLSLTDLDEVYKWQDQYWSLSSLDFYWYVLLEMENDKTIEWLTFDDNYNIFFSTDDFRIHFELYTKYNYAQQILGEFNKFESEATKSSV